MLTDHKTKLLDMNKGKHGKNCFDESGKCIQVL